MDRFHLGAYVRKRSGAFWEGAIVGHYTTAQTPDGIAVQLFGWIDGPVQIYPAAALELCDHSNSRLPPPPQTHVAVTDDQIERAEWKLAEVLTGYHYTMPADGMRRVLEAALATTEGSTDGR